MIFPVFFSLFSSLLGSAEKPFDHFLPVSTTVAVKGTETQEPIPVVVFHGLLDFCYDPAMLATWELIGLELGGYATCIESGASLVSLLQNFPAQVQDACDQLKEMELSKGTFNLVGFSQGGLIARALVEQCDYEGRVSKLITLGTPHQGIGEVWDCPAGLNFFSSVLCNQCQNMGSYFIYTPEVQRMFGPAGYYKDVTEYEMYLRESIFLADLNNEKMDEMTDRYKERMLQLDQFVMYRFYLDTVVTPRDSAWFRFYESSCDSLPCEVIDLEETSGYANDVLGLKTLNERGSLVFETLPGEHMVMLPTDITSMVDKYLK